MQGDLSQEQKQTFAVVADSARSYKADQEGMIFQINSLETTLVDLREERDTLRHEYVFDFFSKSINLKFSNFENFKYKFESILNSNIFKNRCV